MAHAGRPRCGRIPISFTMDPDILEWLKIEAKERRVTQSQIVRDVLLKEMRKDETPTKTYDQPKIIEAVLKALQES